MERKVTIIGLRAVILIIFSVLFGLFLLARGAQGDSWAPPETASYASLNGRYSLDVIPAQLPAGARPDVLLPGDRPTLRPGEKRFSWCQGMLYERLSGARHLVRQIHLSNKVAPSFAMVSDDGRTVATFDNWGGTGYGCDVVAVYSDGRLLKKLGLTALFSPQEINGFKRSTSSIWWFRGAWFDELHAQLIVVGSPALMKLIDLRSGTRGDGGSLQLRNALSGSHRDALELPLELVAEFKLDGTQSVLRSMLADAQLASGIRVRAAVALAMLGDRRGKDLIVAAALHPDGLRFDDVDRARHYAVRYLPQLMGSDCIPVLRRVISGRRSTEVFMAAFAALQQVGPPAVPALVDILRQDKESTNRGEAAAVLGRLHLPEAIPPLLEAIKDPDHQLGQWALRAAIEGGGSTVGPSLAQILGEGSSQDGMIAHYFEKVHLTEAIPPLIAALRRHSQAGQTRSSIIAALEFQTGARLGTDPDVWARWRAARDGSLDPSHAAEFFEYGKFMIGVGDVGGLLWMCRAVQAAPDSAAYRESLNSVRSKVARLSGVFPESNPLAATYTADGRGIMVLSRMGTRLEKWDATSRTALSPAVSRPRREVIPDRRGRLGLMVQVDVEGTIMGHPDAQRQVQVLDLRSGQAVATIKPPGGIYWANFVENDSCVLTCGADGRLRFWDAITGRQVRALVPVPHQWMRYDRDARTFVFVQRQTVTVMDSSTGQRVGTFTLHGNVDSLDVTPDGSRIVTVLEDGAVQFWDREGHHVGSGHHMSKVEVAPGEYSFARILMAFSPDSSTCATARGDRAQVWKIGDGTPAGPELRHASDVTEVELNDDGSLLVANEHDGMVRIWNTRAGTEAFLPIPRGHNEFSGLTFPSFQPGGHQMLLTFPHEVRIYELSPVQGIADATDLDAPADLLELDVELWTGMSLHGRTCVALDAEALDRKHLEYSSLAERHAVTCQFPDANEWLRAHGRR